ncbi:hypothetical protein C1645_824679 [Glomus cerebriforme]|uniref:Uncharacterized protein n=1 Tax=Glomus cerebriforme TaxID=658196 RepID=A0A397T341_9GLOM|nr:hypothetical protein C1645_824679 [Glomus cerebriforme]
MDFCNTKIISATTIQLWKNNDLTDRIIEKIVEENGFTRNYSDIEELESSEDESEFGQVKKLVKRLKGNEDIKTAGKINLMLEKGYELEEIETNEFIRSHQEVLNRHIKCKHTPCVAQHQKSVAQRTLCQPT